MTHRYTAASASGLLPIFLQILREPFAESATWFRDDPSPGFDDF